MASVHFNISYLLKRATADINSQNDLVMLTREAVLNGDVASIKLVVASNNPLSIIALNALDNDARSPLTLAVAHRKQQILELLLATPKIDSCQRSEAIKVAVCLHNIDALATITAPLLNPALPAIASEEALMLAMADKEIEWEIVELLLKAAQGYKGLQVDENKRTALMLACQKGARLIVRLLLAQVQDPSIINQQDISGQSALALAAAYGYSGCVEELLAYKGTNLYLVDLAGNTTLLLAAQHGRHQCVRLLLQAGMNPLQQNNLGQDLAYFIAQNPQLKACCQDLLAQPILPAYKAQVEAPMRASGPCCILS